MTTPNQSSKHPSRFSSYGDFLHAVRRAALSEPLDPRLPFRAAAGPPGQEAVGADGGYLVPLDARATVIDALQSEESLLSLTTRVTTESNSFALPTDVTAAWASTGPQAVYQPEGSTLSQSKVSLQSRSMKLNKLSVFVPVTNELLDDAPALDVYMRAAVADRIVWAVNRDLLNGDGVGKPQGLLNSPALITIAKEASQSTATLLHLNLSKAWASMYPPSKGKTSLVWVMHSSAEQAAQEIISPVGAPSLIYGDDVDGRPRIFGARVIVSSACQALGTPGDVFLADFAQVVTVTKPGAVKQDVSLHCYFDADMAGYRFTFRWAAASLWNAPVTDLKGGATLSTAVVIATRP